MISVLSFSKNYNILKYNKLFLALSALIISISILFLITKGLNFGIDFNGGTLVQVKYNKKVDLTKLRTFIKGTSFEKANVKYFGSDDEVIFRVPTASKSLGQDVGDSLREILKNSGTFEIRRVDIVGPKVGAELREKGFMAMLIAIIGILIYVSFRFEYRFALASILALIHDLSITLGVLALFQIDVNLDILAGLLTILGYSLNDTIVVFDRIRETLDTNKKETNLINIINEAISRTLSRTFLTSLTTFFVVSTLFFFGGEIIKGLSFTLLIGIIVGTYSSVFIAASFLNIFRFNVVNYQIKKTEKEKIAKEKAKMRSIYEQGTV